MSLYNLMNGVNPATFFILPMLGEKHPDNYPRFRDCFVTEEHEIAVYTRVGGGNRNCEYGEEELQSHPNYLRDKDDDLDCTYATFYFSVPEEWKADFEFVLMGELSKTSKSYQERLYAVYPKLKEQFDIMFKPH